jgi:hypothetical protein
MGMNLFQDRLDAVGLPGGVFLVLVGFGTIWGQPWQYSAGGALLMVLQLVGAIAAIAIGVSLVYLVFFVE